MPRSVLCIAGLLGLLLGVGVVAAAPADAHAMVVASTPADGARLKQAPAAVSVTFDEPVGIEAVGYLHVVDSRGSRVDQGAVIHPSPRTIRIALAPGLDAGQYVESYRVVSADSHPVTGAITFVVGAAPATAIPVASAPRSTDPATSLAFDGARWVSFAGFVLLVGGWLAVTIWPAGRRHPRSRSLAQGGAWALTLGTVLELLVQGPYSAGASLGHVGDPALVRAVLHSVYGAAHLWRLALIAALSYLLWTPRRLPRRVTEVSAVLCVLAIAVTFAASGHAWSQHPRWLVITSDTAHVAAMGVWLGGLVYLFAAVLSDGEAVRGAVPMFSRVAFACVLTLAVTGAYQSVRGVVTVDALFVTAYGRLVVAKIVLFVVMVTVANASRGLVLRRYLQPAAHASDWADGPLLVRAPRAARIVRRTVALEATVGAAVLACTAVLVAQSPGDVALAARRDHVMTATAGLGAGRSAQVSVTPRRHGRASITVRLSPGPQPQHLDASAALPARQLGPIDIGLRRTGALTYTATDVLLPAAGIWTIALDVQSSEFDATTTSVTVHLY